MKIICHRGNTFGPDPENENKPEVIDYCIREGHDIEIDLWVHNNDLYLGHDEPTYFVPMDYLVSMKTRLWIHCKNIEALEFFNKFKSDINYFWHEHDTVTLTSKNYTWAYPGKQPIKNSIAVMPEIHKEDINQCIGICSDYIKNY
jgi:hypothetical protein